jgi:ERF superfamily
MGAVRQIQAEAPGKVYQAIAAVTAEMAKEGIAKGRRNQQQGYSFRGIDDVYNALSPVLAKHRLCILPRVTERVVQERETQRGGVLFYVTVKVEFDFVSAEDGSTHTVSTFGEAMDSADKATNKAMSAAYKYAAFQTFCIPTEGDNDADATTAEVGPKTVGAPAAPKVEHPPIAAEDLPQDYFDLVDELEAAATKEELRQWALGTTARRAALPKGAQAKLRELTIEHQNSTKQLQMAAA